MMKQRSLAIALMIGFSLPVAYAQKDAGKKFGARDPQTCSSRKAPASGALSAEQAKQYFICDSEKVVESSSLGELLNLVTDVKVEIGKGRPFNMQADSFGFATDLGIDPSQTVYPIRGSFTSFQCAKIGSTNGNPGKSCSKLPQPEAKGICFKTTFGEWHCDMTDFDHNNPGMERFPAPTGK
jgi:hypothetical protein